jgi:TIR domain-containing protein
MAHDVFVSYPHQDKNTADAACATLEGVGIRCWIAPRDVRPGEDWAASIIKAIGDSKVMVLVFSGFADASPQIKREVERAVHKGISIIPLRVEDIVPSGTLEFFLSTTHWLDAITPPLEQHLLRLAEAVKPLLRLEPPDDDKERAAAAQREQAERARRETEAARRLEEKERAEAQRRLREAEAAQRDEARRNQEAKDRDEQKVSAGLASQRRTADNPALYYPVAFLFFVGVLLVIFTLQMLLWTRALYPDNFIPALAGAIMLIVANGTISQRKWARIAGSIICVCGAFGSGALIFPLSFGLSNVSNREAVVVNELLIALLLVAIMIWLGVAAIYIWGWKSESPLAMKLPDGTGAFMSFMLIINILALAILALRSAFYYYDQVYTVVTPLIFIVIAIATAIYLTARFRGVVRATAGQSVRA